MSNQVLRHRLAGLVLVVLLWAMAASHSHACSCKTSADAMWALDNSDAVFTGLVIGMTLDTSWMTADAKRPIGGCRTQMVSHEHNVALCQKGEMAVRLKVFKAWKGELDEEVEVHTDTQGPACGFAFKIAQTYLVFADRRAEGGLVTNSCSRTALVFKAQEDIEDLGTPVVDSWHRRAMELHAGGESE